MAYMPRVGRLKRPYPKAAVFFPIPREDEWSDEVEDRRVWDLHNAVGTMAAPAVPSGQSNSAAVPFAGSQVAGGGSIKGAAFSGTPGAPLSS